MLWGMVLGLVLLLTVCVEDCDAAKKMKAKVRRVCKQGAKCLLRDDVGERERERERERKESERDRSIDREIDREINRERDR